MKKLQQEDNVKKSHIVKYSREERKTKSETHNTFVESTSRRNLEDQSLVEPWKNILRIRKMKFI